MPEINDFKKSPLILLDWVGAVLATATAVAVFSTPYAVELLTGGLYQRGFIGEYSGFKVATVAALHAYACTSHIGRANVGCLEIKYKHLEMDTRAQHPFQSGF